MESVVDSTFKLQITNHKLQTNYKSKITNYKQRSVLRTSFKRLRRKEGSWEAEKRKTGKMGNNYLSGPIVFYKKEEDKQEFKGKCSNREQK